MLTIGLIIAALLIVAALVVAFGILFGLKIALPDRSGPPGEANAHQREHLPY